MNKFYNGKIDDPVHAFSNGTEAMNWYCNNCDRCSKSFHAENGNWPKESTIKHYVTCGKYCKLQYWIDIGFIEGSIPKEIADQIGMDEIGRLKHCMFFSDNEDDGYKSPKRPRPDRTPPNQLVMPFYLQELGIKEVRKLELT